jgi:hypothetical protein
VARMPSLLVLLIGLAPIAISSGCCSPYHTEQGAVTGGLLGLGTGAVAGHALGNTAAGAAIGTGVGALGGAMIGSKMDETDAKNRAIIAQQLGRQVDPSAVTVSDVVAMTRASVNEDLIINHIHAHGMALPLQTNDLISLPQQGVSSRVIAAMQASPPRVQPAVVVQPSPPPVVVEGYPYYYGPPVYAPPHYYHHW